MKLRGIKPLAGALVLTMAGGACIGGHAAGDTKALTVGRLIGAVRARNGTQQTWYLLKVGMHIPSGATVQVPKLGDVGLKRGTVSSVELRPYDQQAAELRVVDAGHVDVFSGDVLVKDKRAPITVTSQGVTAQPTPSAAVDAPIFRFDRRISVRVGVYTGGATITSLTGTLPIPTLREGVVAARSLPRSATPLTVDPNDVWDRELLPDVIDLDSTLAAQSRGYQAQFGAVMRDWKEIAKIAPGRDLGFIAPYFQNTGSGDILIGTVFALLLELRARGSGAAAFFGTLLSLLDQGATWGLLAHEYLGDNGEQALKVAVTRAIALRTGDIRSGGGAVPSATQTPSSSPTATPSNSPAPKPTPSHSPSHSPTPSPTPKPSPTRSCLIPPLICN
jgi:hypothetical protein